MLQLRVVSRTDVRFEARRRTNALSTVSTQHRTEWSARQECACECAPQIDARVRVARQIRVASLPVAKAQRSPRSRATRDVCATCSWMIASSNHTHPASRDVTTERTVRVDTDHDSPTNFPSLRVSLECPLIPTVLSQQPFVCFSERAPVQASQVANTAEEFEILQQLRESVERSRAYKTDSTTSGARPSLAQAFIIVRIHVRITIVRCLCSFRRKLVESR